MPNACLPSITITILNLQEKIFQFLNILKSVVENI
jgi:hypothetical protein